MNANANAAKFRALSAAARAALVRASAVGAGALLATGGAHAVGTATSVNVDDVVATITGGVATVSTIGVAVLSLVVVIKLFKWVQRTL